MPEVAYRRGTSIMATKTDGATERPSYNRQRSNSDPQPAVDVLNALNTDKGIYLKIALNCEQPPLPAVKAHALKLNCLQAVAHKMSSFERICRSSKVALTHWVGCWRVLRASISACTHCICCVLFKVWTILFAICLCIEIMTRSASSWAGA